MLTNPFAVDWSDTRLLALSTDLPSGCRLDNKEDIYKQLENLDLADDVDLLSHRQQHVQTKLSRLSDEANKTGLKINTKTTELMKIKKQQAPLQLRGENIKETETFTYLGSIVSKNDGADEDIRSKVNKARHAFNTLRPVWNSSTLSLLKKTRIFNTNVKLVLLYG